jgi:co-chaperonin GroES (HSP10)
MPFEGEAELLKKIDDAGEISVKDLVLDGSNKVSFPGFPYTFEGLGERIIVSIDLAVTGYECKTCKGRKRIKHQCECVTCGRSGRKYSLEEIAQISNTLGSAASEARKDIPCSECGGDYKSVEKDELCPDCKGVGATIIIPKTSKNLPQTGVVVSMGAEAKAKAAFKVGDRILFGQYAGGMIPTKAGLMFKYMDWQNALVKIEGAEELAAFDFILNATE